MIGKSIPKKFKNHKVTSMGHMFEYFSVLRSINLISFKKNTMTNIDRIFTYFILEELVSMNVAIKQTKESKT